jgi:hypothetical protein
MPVKELQPDAAIVATASTLSTSLRISCHLPSPERW